MSATAAAEESAVTGPDVGVPVICVQGNIGCGKTSVLSTLHALYEDNIDVHFEDVHAWKMWLELAYAAPMRFLTAFQFKVLMHYFSVGEDLMQRVVDAQFVERGPDAVDSVFIPVAERTGLMTPKDAAAFHGIYSAVFDTEALPWRKAITVYLRCPVDLCFSRVKSRARSGEHGITSAYLEALHQAHEARYLSSADVVIDVQEWMTATDVADRVLSGIAALPASKRVLFK